MFKKIRNYFVGCALELKKVSWPNRTLVYQSTKIVLIASVVCALILGLVDFVLLKGIFFIY